MAAATSTERSFRAVPPVGVQPVASTASRRRAPRRSAPPAEPRTAPRRSGRHRSASPRSERACATWAGHPRGSGRPSPCRYSTQSARSSSWRDRGELRSLHRWLDLAHDLRPRDAELGRSLALPDVVNPAKHELDCWPGEINGSVSSGGELTAKRSPLGGDREGSETLPRLGPHVDVSKPVQLLDRALGNALIIVTDQFGFSFAAP
jgi:hypothetical protein